jgi:hypothetical protein
MAQDDAAIQRFCHVDLLVSICCTRRMFKQQEQLKAMQQGKNLAGAVAMDKAARDRPNAGHATKAMDLIVSGISTSSRGIVLRACC